MSPTYTRAVGRIRADRRPRHDPGKDQEVEVGSKRGESARDRRGAETDPDYPDPAETVGCETPERLRQSVREVVRGRGDGDGSERGAELKRDGDQDRCDREPVDHGYEWTRRQKPDVEPRVSHCRPSG